MLHSIEETHTLRGGPCTGLDAVGFGRWLGLADRVHCTHNARRLSLSTGVISTPFIKLIGRFVHQENTGRRNENGQASPDTAPQAISPSFLKLIALCCNRILLIFLRPIQPLLWSDLTANNPACALDQTRPRQVTAQKKSPNCSPFHVFQSPLSLITVKILHSVLGGILWIFGSKCCGFVRSLEWRFGRDFQFTHQTLVVIFIGIL